MSATPTKKVILVTGGSRGIGLAAVRFLLHGTKTIPACNVVSLSRSVPAELQALAKEHTSLAIVQGDVTTSKSNEEMRDEALKRWGRIDGLLLNAGVIDHMRCADLTAERLLHVLNVNTVSIAESVRVTLPELRKTNGSVVMVSSGAAVSNYASWAAYNASKAALNAYARTLANEEKDIACFSVRPGVVDTDMQGLIRATTEMPTEQQAKFLSMHKNGELLSPEKPAHVLAALAVQGTRKEPVGEDGTPLGATGTFCSWDDASLSAYQL